MHQVNVHEAKTNLSKLLEEAKAGNDIIIAKAGKPIARLTAFVNKQPPRLPGRLKGQISITDEDDFDNTSDEIINLFYNSKLFPDEQ